MPFKLDDRALWLGLGVFAFVAIRTVSYALKETLRLTEIHEEPRKHFCDVCQDTEDAIKADSLSVLACSPNLDIRQAATRILCNRFLSNPHNLSSLDRDSKSSNPQISHSALQLYKLLLRYSPDHHGLDALRHSIENSLPREPPGLTALSGSYRADGTYVPSPPRPREREESMEEQQLRRRRREAIVLNEGDRPLSQDDIIQRSGNSMLPGTGWELR